MRKKFHSVLTVMRSLLLIPVAAFVLDYATTEVVKAIPDPTDPCVIHHHPKLCHVHKGASHE